MGTFGDLQQQQLSDEDDSDSSDEEYVPGKGSDDDDASSSCSSAGEAEDAAEEDGQESSGTKKVKVREASGRRRPRPALAAVGGRGARRGGIRLEGEDADDAEAGKAMMSGQAAADTAASTAASSTATETAKDERAKQRADALWASFLSDVGGRGSAAQQTATARVEPPPPQPQPQRPPQEKRQVAKIFDFAGESVSVPVDVAGPTSASTSSATKRPAAGAAVSGGVRGLLDRLTKRPKLSTLEKSRLDWESFKSTEGIGEDLAAHNRGKAGYLERRAFLERADYRQFERERDARHMARGSQGGGSGGKA